MTQRVAFPFLVLPDRSIRFKGWLLGDPGRPLQPATSVLEDWDYARDLEVATSIEIDWAIASATLQLPLDSLRLKVSLVVGTGAGRLPRWQAPLAEVITNHVSGETSLSGIVPGWRLSGRLRVGLSITLDGPCNDGNALSPKLRGARLWQARHDILLEDGGDSRFPIEAASFSRVFHGKPQAQAPWYLHWRPGTLQADFSANVRLYVNSDRPDLFARFVNGDAGTLQAIMGDVASQMVESVLAEEDASEILGDFDEGSVGQQIVRWLDIAFPGQDIATVKAMHAQNPGAFRAAILGAVEMEEAAP